MQAVVSEHNIHDQKFDNKVYKRIIQYVPESIDDPKCVIYHKHGIISDIISSNCKTITKRRPRMHLACRSKIIRIIRNQFIMLSAGQT